MTKTRAALLNVPIAESSFVLSLVLPKVSEAGIIVKSRGALKNLIVAYSHLEIPYKKYCDHLEHKSISIEGQANGKVEE